MDTVTFFIAVGIFFYVLTCWAIIDVAVKEFSSLPVKAAWGFTAFIPFVGWMIYFAFGAKRGKHRKRSQQNPAEHHDERPGSPGGNTVDGSAGDDAAGNLH